MPSFPLSIPNSTNVRNRLLAMLMRTEMKLTSALAPEKAVDTAARLFSTPPRFDHTERERELLSTGMRYGVATAHGEIAAWRFGRSDRPAVVLVHGWGGRGAQLASVVPPLVANGYSVITFDAPGHGQSPGRRSSLIAFVQAIHAVSRALGPVRGVIAHSIGAAAAACALRDGLRTDAAVFLAPPADLTLHADIMLETLGFGRRARELMRERVERRLGVAWSTLDVAGFAPQMRTPLLVIHDREDAEVPWQEGAIIAQAWPGATLSTTSGLGHRRIVRDRDVVREAVSFVLAELHGRRLARPSAPQPVMASA